MSQRDVALHVIEQCPPGTTDIIVYDAETMGGVLYLSHIEVGDRVDDVFPRWTTVFECWPDDGGLHGPLLDAVVRQFVAARPGASVHFYDMLDGGAMTVAEALAASG